MVIHCRKKFVRVEKHQPIPEPQTLWFVAPNSTAVPPVLGMEGMKVTLDCEVPWIMVCAEKLIGWVDVVHVEYCLLSSSVLGRR